MDQEINNNQEEHQIHSKHWFGFASVLMLSIVLACGVVYYLMNQQFKDEKSNLAAQIESERQAKEMCEGEKEECEKNKNCELEIKGRDLTIEKLKSTFSENIDILDTTKWKTKDTSEESKIIVKFKYPPTWISEHGISGGASSGFSFFDTASFDSTCEKNEKGEIKCGRSGTIGLALITSAQREFPEFEQSTIKDVIVDGHPAVVTQGKAKQDSKAFGLEETKSMLTVENIGSLDGNVNNVKFIFEMTTNTEEEEKVFDLLINTIDFQ